MFGQHMETKGQASYSDILLVGERLELNFFGHGGYVVVLGCKWGRSEGKVG